MKDSVARAIKRFGELVTLTYVETSQTVSLTASVQRPVADNIVGDFETTAFVVYVPFDDLTVPPKKFDRLRIRGEIRSIEDVQVERSQDQSICYMMRTRG